LRTSKTPSLEITKSGSGAEVSVASMVRWVLSDLARAWRPGMRSRAAIVLNDRARLPSSSRENSGRGCRGSPSPSAIADAVSAFIGVRSDAATNQARTAESATAAAIATDRTPTAVFASCSACASVSREAA
jgi:hypothetical protein